MRHGAIVFACLVACSSSSGSPAGAGGDAGTSADSAPDVSAGTVVEHGVLVDYFTLKPVAGLTVTDNGVSTTTDANGAWSLMVPKTSAFQVTVSGPSYTQLLFPDGTASGSDADYGTVVIPDSSSYNLEQNSLTAFDPAKALVQLVFVNTGACTSVAGGTVKVLTPAGTSLTYFAGATGIPTDAVKSLQDGKPNRAQAVVYNIPVGADLTLQIDHPTCKAMPFPATGTHGITLSGKTRTRAAEPGDVNASLVLFMQ